MAAEQAKFTAEMGYLGYETKTTFFGDLSIAEWYGDESVKETYHNVVESWGGSVEFFTEFVMCLNHKGWEHHQLGKNDEKRMKLSKLYFDLYEKVSRFVEKNFDEKGLEYYYRVTD